MSGPASDLFSLLWEGQHSLSSFIFKELREQTHPLRPDQQLSLKARKYLTHAHRPRLKSTT